MNNQFAIYPAGVPNDNNKNIPDTEVYQDNRIWKVTIPTLFPYPIKDQNTPAPAVLICPGGGYARLAIDKEGLAVAEWLNSIGISAFILKYRLATDDPNQGFHFPAQLNDAKRAMRTIRANAGEYNIDPNRIGILGFSAGGHLASTLCTHFDDGDKTATDPIETASCKPDFAMLIYAHISIATPDNRPSYIQKVLGENYDPDLIDDFSNEKHVTKDTPPTFLVHADDDKTVNPSHSIIYYQALKEQNIPAELHIFKNGGHGFGLGVNGGPVTQWPKLAQLWLLQQNIIE